MYSIEESQGQNTWYLINRRCLITAKGEVRCHDEIIKIFYRKTTAIKYLRIKNDRKKLNDTTT